MYIYIMYYNVVHNICMSHTLAHTLRNTRIHTYTHSHSHTHTYVYIYIHTDTKKNIYMHMPVNNGMERTRKHVFLLGQWRNHPISDVKDPCPKLNRPKDREAANEWFIVQISPPTTGAHYPSEFVWQFFVVLIQKKSFCTRDVIRLMDHVSFQPSHRHSQKPTR